MKRVKNPHERAIRRKIAEANLILDKGRGTPANVARRVRELNAIRHGYTTRKND